VRAKINLLWSPVYPLPGWYQGRPETGGKEKNKTTSCDKMLDSVDFKTKFSKSRAFHVKLSSANLRGRKNKTGKREDNKPEYLTSKKKGGHKRK
jgi:hypothetical protein